MLVTPSRSSGQVFGPTGRHVSFGFITDCHHDPIKDMDTEKYYKDTAQKITDIVGIFNNNSDLSFAFQNGDFIDGAADAATAINDLTTITNIFKGCRVPIYHNIGNHEVSRLTKPAIMAVTGQPSKWYSFVKGGVTFIVLDGNYTADDDSADLSESAGTSPSPYVSFIPPAERLWLRNTIDASPYPCVIICHYPMYYVGAESWAINNSSAVRAILEESGNKVIACIGGHLHDNFIRQYNGIMYVNVHATVTGAYPSLNYATITVYPDTREIKVISSGFDMSYISGVAPGNVVAPSVTNLLTHSETPVQWSITGAFVSQNVDNLYNGQTLGHRFIELDNLSGHNLNSANINFTNGTTYTFSVYCKYETSQYIQLLYGSAGFGANAWGNFDIQNGKVKTLGTAAKGTVDNLGNGWYRINLTATATATAAAPVAIFAANSATMTRALSYTGALTNTRLIANAQVEANPDPHNYKSTEPSVSLTGNTGNAIVGAIRWDAWFHPTQDSIRTAIETDLNPPQYRWRLPFFSKTDSGSAVISGKQADMDAEIDYAAEAGLDYWAFFWYGVASSNGMDQGWNYYQNSSKKNKINWCLYFSGMTPFHGEVTNNLTNIISYMKQGNYQRTATGRPLVYVYDDTGSKATLAADVTALRNAAIAAGLSNPYIAFTQSTPSGSVITTYGFDATTMYTPINSVSGAKTYSQLDTAARAKWDVQAAESVGVIPCFTMGWDRRPRVENPVPWEGASGALTDYYYEVRSSDISTHIDACLAWVRANPTVVPSNVVLGYAWNENDEGGWIVPTKASIGVNRSHLDAVKAVLNA